MRRNEPGKMFSPELAVARAVGAQSPKNKKNNLQKQKWCNFWHFPTRIICYSNKNQCC